MKRVILSFLILGALSPVDGRGHPASIHVVPRTGFHVVDNRDLVRVGDEWAGADGSPVVGVSLEMDLPVRWLGFRASVDRTLFSELVVDEPAGTESCGANCTRFLTRESRVGDFAMWIAGADVVVRPFPSTWRVRPFFVGGTGLKHYRLDEDEVRAEGLWASGAHDTLRPRAPRRSRIRRLAVRSHPSPRGHRLHQRAPDRLFRGDPGVGRGGPPVHHVRGAERPPGHRRAAGPAPLTILST